MAARQARVTAPYATVRVDDPALGLAILGFYQGAPFPANAMDEDVERLVRRGYAEWVDEVEGPADPGASIDETPPQDGDDGLAPQRPGDSASKAAWVDYAVAKRDEGVSEAEAREAAEAMTKNDLITVHG
jgi:hypothetical protein